MLAKYFLCNEFTIFTGQYLRTPSPHLSLHCKDREFPAYFDVVPKKLGLCCCLSRGLVHERRICDDFVIFKPACAYAWWALKVTRHLCFKNSKNLRPQDILALNSVKVYHGKKCLWTFVVTQCEQAFNQRQVFSLQRQVAFLYMHSQLCSSFDQLKRPPNWRHTNQMSG